MRYQHGMGKLQHGSRFAPQAAQNASPWRRSLLPILRHRIIRLPISPSIALSACRMRVHSHCRRLQWRRSPPPAAMPCSPLFSTAPRGPCFPGPRRIRAPLRPLPDRPRPGLTVLLPTPEVALAWFAFSAHDLRARKNTARCQAVAAAGTIASPYQDTASPHCTDAGNAHDNMIRKCGLDMEKILHWMHRFNAVTGATLAIWRGWTHADALRMPAMEMPLRTPLCTPLRAISVKPPGNSRWKRLSAKSAMRAIPALRHRSLERHHA